jgi:hypothetical protein
VRGDREDDEMSVESMMEREKKKWKVMNVTRVKVVLGASKK